MSYPPTPNPQPLEYDDLCGDCHQHPKAPGDWLCAKCRRETDAEWNRARRALAEAFAQALASREAQTD